jgi:hypothetical protein
MDHSEMAVDLLAEVSRKDLVTHSWLAKGIKLVHMVENLLQVKCSECCQCASKTEACYHDLGVSVNWEQGLDILANVAFDSEESVVESLMDQATITERVLNLIGVNINNPVLDTGGASEADNNSIQVRWVTGVSEDVENGVAESFGLDDKKGGTERSLE